MNENYGVPEFPPISPLLIEALDQVFPDKLPTNPHYTDRDVACAIGWRQVIDRLTLEMKRQSGKLR